MDVRLITSNHGLHNEKGSPACNPRCRSQWKMWSIYSMVQKLGVAKTF